MPDEGGAPAIRSYSSIESERAKLYAFLVGPDISGNGALVRHIHLHIRGVPGRRPLGGTYSGLNWFVRGFASIVSASY